MKKTLIPIIEDRIDEMNSAIKKLELLKDCLLCGNWRKYGDEPKFCEFYKDSCPPKCTRRKRVRDE